MRDGTLVDPPVFLQRSISVIHLTMILLSGQMIRHSTELSRQYNFPSQEAFKAYDHIAREVRAYAGIPES